MIYQVLINYLIIVHKTSRQVLDKCFWHTSDLKNALLFPEFSEETIIDMLKTFYPATYVQYETKKIERQVNIEVVMK